MKISIVTVNLNNAVTLEKTIKSVINQKFTDFEYLIVDGGSTDESVDIIKRYTQKISYWVSEKDTGIYNAMNKAIEIANGDYCIFLNSGDVFYDELVLKNIQAFLTADFVCGDACLIYSESESTSLWKAPVNVDELYFVQRLSVCHQSLFIKTSLLKKRHYDESLKIVADYEQLFFEIIVNHRIYRKADMIVCYYGCDGISSDDKRSDAEKLVVIKNFQDKNYIEKDELQVLVNNLKIGTRKYKLVLAFVKYIVNVTSYYHKLIKR
jgi:putative colanic acid biosynthesis glycosyltransferase